MRNVGAGMSLAITTPLAAVAGAGLRAAAGFEESMNLIQTVGGATAEQMQNVQQQALQLGKDTSFSAGEAAEGFLELTKAGFGIESSMSAIGGVLDLAAAGSLSVASAAEIASNAINAFGLPASDATRIADLLAAGANASSVEVTDLSDSLKMSGSVMSSYGQSLDDTVTALGLLGNAGLKGSDAGTSLKQMFISLAAPTDKARKLMSGLGINIYDAQGAMLPFEEILYEIQDGFQGMTEEQRNAAAATLFGSDAVRAANILLRSGADGWNEMSRAVRKGGAASEVAASRQKGFNGAMEYFKGTMESLLIEVLLPFLDTLSGGLRWIADLVALFTQLPRPVQYAALAFLAVLAAIGPVLLAISGLATVMGLLLSPIGLIGVAIAALAAAWASNWGDIQGKVKAAWDFVKPIFDSIVRWLQDTAGRALAWLQGKWNEVWPTLQTAVSGMWSVVEPIFTAIRDWVGEKIGAGLSAVQSAWETTWPAIQTAVSTAWTTIQGVFIAIGGWLAVAIPIAIEFLGGVWSTVWGALQTAVSTAWGIIEPIFTSIQDWVKTHMPTSLPTFGEAWSALWAGIQTATQSAWLAIAPYLGSISAWVKTNLPTALPTLQSAWGAAWTGIQTATQSAWTAIAPYLQSTLDWVKTNLPNALPTLQSAWKTAWAGIQAATSAGWLAIAPYLQSVRAWVETKLPVVLPILQEVWRTTWAAIQTAVTDAWTEIAPKLEQIRVWMSETYPQAVETANTETTPALESIATSNKETTSLIKQVWDQIVTWFEPIVERFLESWRKMKAGLSDLGLSWQGVWDAIQPVIRYIQVGLSGLLLFIGLVVAGIAALFLNLASAIMDGVVPIVSGISEMISGVWESISVGWKGTIELIGGLIEGDWKGAWNAAGEIVRATGLLISSVWAGIWGVIYGILTIIGSFVQSVLEDMGVNVEASLQAISQTWNDNWDGMLGMIRSVVAGWIALWTTVRQWLVWTLPGAADSLKTKFETTWNAVKSFLLDTILAPIIAALDGWRTLMTETLPNAINSFKNFLSNLRLPNPFEGLLSAIGSVLSGLQAIWDFLQKIAGVQDWNPLGGASASSAEPVAPSGARSLQPVGAGSGGIQVNVNIDAGGISNGVDVEALAYRVANRTVEEIRRRVR